MTHAEYSAIRTLSNSNEEQEHLRSVALMEVKVPVVCKMFGCGKHLSIQEQLFGDYCPDHGRPKKFDITKVIKFE